MEAFPAFFPLAGRRVVLAGEGEGAEAKARLLAGSPARLDRVGGAAALRPETYAGAVLAFVASRDPAFCEAAAAAARGAGAPVNVVDHPELSNFHTPAIVDRGQVVAAIGTAGAAPIAAALLRAELEARIAPGLGRMTALFGRMRAEIRAALPDLSERRAFMRAALRGPAGEAADADDMALAERLLREAMETGARAAGRVWLIAAPADADLLSLRAARILAEVDVLALADDVAPGVALLARRDASRRRLAETGADFLAAEAAAGRQAAVIAPLDALAPIAAALAALGAPHLTLEPAPGA